MKNKSLQKCLIRDDHHLCFQEGFGGIGYTHQPQNFLLELPHQLATRKTSYSPLQANPSSQCIGPSSSLSHSHLLFQVVHCTIPGLSLIISDLSCLHAPNCGFDYIGVPATLNPNHLTTNLSRSQRLGKQIAYKAKSSTCQWQHCISK